MGKCNVCGKKIQYNQYEKVDGVIYCSSCYSKKTRQILDEGKIALDEALTVELGEPLKMTFVKDAMEKTIRDAKLDFSEFQKSMDEVAKITVKKRKARRKKSKKVKK